MRIRQSSVVRVGWRFDANRADKIGSALMTERIWAERNWAVRAGQTRVYEPGVKPYPARRSGVVRVGRQWEAGRRQWQNGRRAEARMAAAALAADGGSGLWRRRRGGWWRREGDGEGKVAEAGMVVVVVDGGRR